MVVGGWWLVVAGKRLVQSSRLLVVVMWLQSDYIVTKAGCVVVGGSRYISGWCSLVGY